MSELRRQRRAFERAWKKQGKGNSKPIKPMSKEALQDLINNLVQDESKTENKETGILS